MKLTFQADRKTKMCLRNINAPETAIYLRNVTFMSLSTHNQMKILDSSKLQEFADNNFKFDQNGRKLSKWVENTVGKGEIALYEQFLLFPQCFQNACFPGASKGFIVWEWVNLFSSELRGKCEVFRLSFEQTEGQTDRQTLVKQ